MGENKKHCRYCNLDCSDMNMGQFGNHRRWCDKNPNLQKHKLANSERAKLTAIGQFGEFEKFAVVCDVCSTEFIIEERTKLFNQEKIRHCSRICANSKGGVARSNKLEKNNELSYRTIAAKHHQMKCVVCGEEKIVAIHHLNENHADNRPENLIPLCPTHHQYMHSKYSVDIQDIIDYYVMNKWHDK